MNLPSTCLCFAALAGLTNPAVADGEPSRAFDAADVFELEYASEPRVSPDGSRVVYERRMNDIMTDATVSCLWSVGLDGAEHRPLGADGPATSPRWSPSGDRIAYLQAEDSATHVMMYFVDSARAGRIATLQDRPSGLTWSPDGSRLAFTLPVAATPAPRPGLARRLPK